MNTRDFKKLIAAHGITGAKTIEALRLVMVEGKSAYESADLAGIHRSAVTRANKLLERPLCPHCGQPMKL